jgi:hypothetical protein
MKWFLNNIWTRIFFNNKGFADGNGGGSAGDGDGGVAGDGDGGAAGGGDGTSGPASTGTPVDHGDPNPPPEYKAPELDMKTAIPPEHRNKDYFKDITFEKLVDQHVNLQTKLGTRPEVGVPGADATEEQIKNFYDSLRPDDKTKYEFPETEFSKAHGRDEEFQTGMRDVFHEAGVSQHQVKLLTEGYDKLAEGIKAKADADDQNFDQQISDIYKDDREKALTTAKDLMKAHIPENLKPELEKLDNRALLLLTTTLNGVHKKYIAEDGVGPANQNATGDVIALREEAMNIYKSSEYRDFRHSGHDAAVARYKDLYTQIAAIQNGKATT